MLRLIASGSPAQSGKWSGLRVRQTCTCPLRFLSPWRVTTSWAAAAADGAVRPASNAATALERAQPLVRPAQPVPDPEIEPIIASIKLVVAMMMAGGDQPAPGLS